MDTQHTHRSAGFTLIETAIVVMIASLGLAGFMSLANIYTKKTMMETTKQRMIDIKVALAKFQAKNGRLPCPALRKDASTAITFGKEACNTTPPTDPKQVTGTSPGSKVRIGAVPVTDLGLSSDHMTDYWGWRYVYAASEPLTVTGATDPEFGEITLKNAAGLPIGGATYAGHTPYIVFSPGQDGAGAVTLEGKDSPRTCPATGLEHENCKMTDATFSNQPYSATTNTATRFTQIMSTTLSATDPAAFCGNKGMIYGPAHAKADANGCVPNMVEAANGMVGVGTASPLRPLHIVTSGQTDVTVESTTDNRAIIDFLNAGSGLVMGAEPTSGNTVLVGTTPNSAAIGQQQPTSLHFGTDNHVKMTIDASGNVGIGTSSPTSPLQVQASYNGNWATQILNTGTTNAHGLWVDIGPSSTGVPLRVSQNNTSYLEVTNGGLVGIGVTNPVAKLDVRGDVRIGNTGAACTAVNEGAQRYNATAKNMEFCNGTAWKTMGGASTTTIRTAAVAGSGHFAATASCNAGETVVGGGCEDSCNGANDAGVGNTGLVDSYPNSATSWRCASRDISTGCSRTLTAYAICR